MLMMTASPGAEGSGAKLELTPMPMVKLLAKKLAHAKLIMPKSVIKPLAKILAKKSMPLKLVVMP
jgi:hypothetical protein